MLQEINIRRQIELDRIEIRNLKDYLVSTDYMTTRESEGGEAMPQEVKTERANARVEINRLQDEIKELREKVQEEDEKQRPRPEEL